MSRISLIHQEGSLKSYFPGSKINRKGEYDLTWVGVVKPSPLSATYTLKLHYHYDEGVKVYVLEPKPLQLVEGKKSLPHVYNTDEQRLCLYYPDKHEWNTGMYYVHTLIPWACEWLYHYELWVSTGTWNGGGIHHETETEKNSRITNDEINDKKSRKCY